MPPCKVGHRFNAVLAEEWQGLFNLKWNYKIPLVFIKMVLTRTLRANKDREIQARIDHHLYLWERGIHAGLAENALTEGRDRDGRVK